MNTIKLTKIVIALAIMLTIGLTYVVPIYAAGSSTVPHSPIFAAKQNRLQVEPISVYGLTTNGQQFYYIPIVMTVWNASGPVRNAKVTTEINECGKNPASTSENCQLTTIIKKTDGNGIIRNEFVVQTYINGILTMHADGISISIYTTDATGQGLQYYTTLSDIGTYD